MRLVLLSLLCVAVHASLNVIASDLAVTVQNALPGNVLVDGSDGWNLCSPAASWPYSAYSVWPNIGSNVPVANIIPTGSACVLMGFSPGRSLNTPFTINVGNISSDGMTSVTYAITQSTNKFVANPLTLTGASLGVNTVTFTFALNYQGMAAQVWDAVDIVYDRYFFANGMSKTYPNPSAAPPTSGTYTPTVPYKSSFAFDFVFQSFANKARLKQTVACTAAACTINSY